MLKQFRNMLRGTSHATSYLRQAIVSILLLLFAHAAFASGYPDPWPGPGPNPNSIWECTSPEAKVRLDAVAYYSPGNVTTFEWHPYSGPTNVLLAHLCAIGNAPGYFCPSFFICYAGDCKNGTTDSPTLGDGSGSCVPFNDTNHTTNNPHPQSCPATPNPINPLTGAKRLTVETGISIGGLALTLNYDTTPNLPGNGPSGFAYSNVFGGLWMSSLHHQLQLPVPSGPALIGVARGDGTILQYQGPNTWTATNAANANTLVAIPEGYRFTDVETGDQELFNSNGVLYSIYRAQGGVLYFSHTGNLTSVTDDFGHGVFFNYDANNRIQTIIGAKNGIYFDDDNNAQAIPGSDSNVINVTYDANGNLQTLTWADGKVYQYLYENSSFPWAMTGRIDENGSRYITYTYDSQGRAVAEVLAGGVGNYSINYTTPPSVVTTDTLSPSGDGSIIRTHSWQAPVGTTMTLPNGQTSALGAAIANKQLALASSSQPAGSGCAASSNAVTYDANGNIFSVDDFQGTRTCNVYDPIRNLKIASVSGLSTTTDCSTVTAANASLPAGSRKTATQYHPDLTLVTKTSAALSITTNVYNGQPDPFNGNAKASCTSQNQPRADGTPIAVLCKQVVQATTDAQGTLGFAATLDTSVPTGVTSYTYDGSGHMLTTTDGASHTTTYTYEGGNVQSITGPGGLVTTFDNYDQAGNVLRMTDPKGIVTVMSYTPRGWISSVVVTPPGGTARTTTYSYDNVGQVTGISNPDGTTVSYTYDAAHRLVGATDAKGNSVTYTLDNVGNRISEQLKDPGGVLQRTMNRSFDALNRVQQTQLQ